MTLSTSPRSGAPTGWAALVAVAELRLLLFRRRLLGRGGLAEGIAHLAGFGFAALLGVAVALLVAAGSFRAARAAQGFQVKATAAGVFFGLWAAWTSLSLTVHERELLDLRRLLVYPVAAGRLYLTAVAAAVVGDPVSLSMGLVLLGAVAGAWLGRPGAWVLLLALVVALFAAATCALIALAQEALARIGRHRRLRELALVAALGGWAALAVGSVASARAPLATARAFAALRWIAYPAALASEAAQRLYSGEAARALPWAAGLVVAAAATLLAAYRVALGTALSGGEGALPVPAPRPGGGGGWSARLGPLVEKELRYLARHPLARIALVVVPILAALLGWRGDAALRQTRSDVLRALPLFGVAAYAHLALQAFWINGFGWERGGARVLFLAPVTPERVLAAKNAAVAIGALALFVAAASAWVAAAGLPPTWALVSALVLHVGMAPALYGLGNAVSIVNPRAAAFGVQRGGAVPQLSALAGMAIFSGVAFLFAGPIFLAIWVEAPLVIPASWVVLGAGALAAWRLSLPVVGGLLVRRREQLLAAVCGDDA